MLKDGAKVVTFHSKMFLFVSAASRLCTVKAESHWREAGGHQSHFWAKPAQEM